MLLSLPPRPSSRSRLVPELSLCAGDWLARRYRVLSLAGADRASACFAAVERGTNARVEVQILLAADEAIDAVHLRFLADARKAAAIQSPHVDRVLDAGVTDDGRPFLVREPPSGETLETLLQKTSLPTEGAVDVAIAVCEALASAHAVGLVHGALDTTSVHLAWTGEGPSDVKVAGLGSSRALAMLPFDGRSLVSAVLRAPELLLAEGEMDARADVYAVGVMLYTMLAGEPPFAGDSPSMKDLSAASDEPALLAGVPEGLAEIVDACLARDPELRPTSAASLSARLMFFGTRPVFQKRSSQLVLDTGRFNALDLDRLVQEAVPSQQSFDVELDAPEPPTVAMDRSREPVALTPSVPPVAISSPPPPLMAQVGSRSARGWRATALVAAACAVLGLVAVQRITSGPPSRSLASAQHVETTTGAEAATTPVADAPSAFSAPVTVTELPQATPAAAGAAQAAARSAKPAVAGSAQKPVAAAASPAPVAAAAPEVDPLVRAASAPLKSQPKASDDDLRRFLDDRR